MAKYLKALRRHPGVPIASALTALGFVAGASGERWLLSGALGAAVMSVFWLPVLLTAGRN
jgi:hypothetical protein